MKKLFTFIVALMATVAVNADNQTKGPKITAPTELAGWYVGYYVTGNTYSNLKKMVDQYYVDDHFTAAEWTDDDQSFLEGATAWQQPSDYTPYGTIANDGTFYGSTEANNSYIAFLFVDNARLVKGAHWKIYLAPQKGECTLTNADLYLQGTFGTGLTPTAINNIDANTSTSSAQTHGVVKTANYIIKNGKRYNYAGQRVK